MNRLKKSQKEKHEFALYINSLSALMEKKLPGHEVVISDEKVVYRMMFVLRLKDEDECIFFDKNIHIKCVIKTFIGKKQVHCIVQSQHINRVLSSTVTFLLPILKRDDFEAALYSLTEVGITTIQLLLTQKSHHSSFDQKDFERAQRIIIAAAEQSKNFSYPELKMPCMLPSISDIYSAGTKIFFDQNGNSFWSVVESLHRERPSDIVLLVGPEGDLSNEEKDMIVSKGFIVCTLTHTVLRSVQAVALSAGLVRSLLS